MGCAGYPGTLVAESLCHTKPVEGGNSRKTMDAQRLKSMLELIQKEYNEPLDLARIARAANIGERECLRCFHRYHRHFAFAVSAAVSCFSGGAFAAGNQSACGGSGDALRF